MIRNYSHNTLAQKTYDLAKAIIDVVNYLQGQREYILSKQLMRSGTAPGALVREALQAESKADLIHKLCIALKETDETDYWLSLLTDKGFIASNQFAETTGLHNEVFSLLTAIIKTSKGK